MAVNKGDIRTSANYDVQIQAPLDARAVRPTKADLINKESWSYDGSTIYAYEGMQVFVEDEKKTYFLKDISRLTAADYSGWELMGTGAGQEIEVIDNLNSTDTTAALSANQGRVIADELAGKQDRLMDGINIKTINGENITGQGNIVIEGGGTPVEVINSLDSESTTAALSANQGRELKRMIDASNGQVYAVYVTPDTEDKIAANVQAYNAASNGETATFLILGNGANVVASTAVFMRTYVMFFGAIVSSGSQSESSEADIVYTFELVAVKADGSILLAQESGDGTYNVEKITELLAAKQDALVSGTNIKTINNQSILGSGNITIEGGGGGGGLETRILYVPEMTAAGSELTAEEKAYNVETVSKMLAGTARVAIAAPGMINLTATDAINMAMFRGEGTLIVFDYDFVPFDLGFVIGADGDILLNFPASTIYIVEEELSNTDFTALGMCLYYRYMCGAPPSIYLLESNYDDIIPCGSISILGEGSYTLDFTYYALGRKHIAILTAYNGDGNLSIDFYPDRIYINSSSYLDLESNRNWLITHNYTAANKTPAVVHPDSYHSPFCVNVSEEYADFTIYRNDALEVWRILASDGTSSLISTSQLQFATTE